ncbi:hypothetical protein [Mucilaginibacter sp. L196]|uniref:hypothetical protein n=1 Tax=Mucilaginibacter sp. L196 TaxID=1641870 RepID=UPI00131E442F|nr:hypothetical protein [Mucilaginibacter sp. L196]
MIRIWRLSGLCLCLIFSSLLISCAVKRGVKTTNQTAKRDGIIDCWQIEVIVRPVYNTSWMSDCAELFFVQPYNISQIYTDDRQVLSITFRANDYEQMQWIREELLSHGTIEQMNIIKESN